MGLPHFWQSKCVFYFSWFRLVGRFCGFTKKGIVWSGSTVHRKESNTRPGQPLHKKTGPHCQQRPQKTYRQRSPAAPRQPPPLGPPPVLIGPQPRRRPTTSCLLGQTGPGAGCGSESLGLLRAAFWSEGGGAGGGTGGGFPEEGAAMAAARRQRRLRQSARPALNERGWD